MPGSEEVVDTSVVSLMDCGDTIKFPSSFFLDEKRRRRKGLDLREIIQGDETSLASWWLPRTSQKQRKIRTASLLQGGIL